MSELQKKIQVQNILQQNIATIMQEFDVSPSIIDDILSKISLQIKDLIIQEILISSMNDESSNEQNINKEELDGNQEINNES